MMRHLLVILAICFASVAHADIAVPELDACRGKKAGDACPDGVCKSIGKECQAGACRRHADEATCLADQGCSWQEILRCEARGAEAASPAASPAETSAAAASPTEKSSCAATPGVLGVALIALLWRRRR